MARVASGLALGFWLLHAAAGSKSEPPPAEDGGASDEECGGGKHGRECAVSLMQLPAATHQRPAALVAQHRSRVSRISRARGDGGIELESRFFQGSGPSPAAVCTGNEVALADDGGDGPRAVVYNSFGASGAGQSWHSGSFVIKDGPSPRWVAMGDTITLVLGVTAQNASFALSPCNIYVEGLGAPIETPVDFKAQGSPDCPPAECLMAKPRGEAVPERISTPHCGFANTTNDSAVSQACPAFGEHKDLEFDITGLVKKGFLEFQVFASPSELIRGAFWQTPRLTVTSWGFTYAEPGPPNWWTDRASSDVEPR